MQLKTSFKWGFVASTLLGIYGCGAEATNNAAGHLAGTETAQTVQHQEIDRPTYDRAKILAATEEFRKRNGGTYDNAPLCLPLGSDKYYFWVLKGKTELLFPNSEMPTMPAYTAGLVDAAGKVIIPQEMSKIGNPGGTADGYIEVCKNGKWGMYDLNGKVAIPIEMDGIYPYKGSSEVLAQVRRGNSYGWADRKGGVHFDAVSHSDASLFKAPSVKSMIETWKFGTDNKTIHFYIDVRPNPYEGEDPPSGEGVVFTPSYMHQMGLLPEAQSRINVFGNEEFGVDDLSASIQSAQDIDNDTKGFFATFSESGMDARGYNYDKKMVVTTNDKMERVDKLDVLVPGAYVCSPLVEMRFVTPSLLEVKKLDGSEKHNTYGQMTQYSYYEISPDGKIGELKTNRIFAFTKYVTINETYFAGCFSRAIDEAIDKGYNEDEHNMVMTQHLSIEDLDIMRNEIFAEYGYKFTTDKWKKYFSAKSWYKPLYDNVDDKLSPIDKANVQTILNMKEKLKSSEAKYLKKEYAMYVAAG